MAYSALADMLMGLHLLFVTFVIAGGALVLRWRRLIWLHLPCAVWGVAVELTGWVCPLTPLENHLRRLGGEAGYGETFVVQYLMPVLYPAGLKPSHQYLLGLLALLVNAGFYAWFLHRRKLPGATTSPSAPVPPRQ